MEKRQKGLVLLVVIMSLVHWSCSDKLVKDTSLEPKVKDKLVLMVSKFVNEEEDPTLDIYEEAFPKRIISSLSEIKKVKYPLKYEILSNKAKVIKKSREINDIRRAYRFKRLDDTGIVSRERKGVEAEEAGGGFRRTYEAVSNRTGEVEAVRSYLSYFKKRKPKYEELLGLSVNKETKVKGLSVRTSLTSHKLLEVFNEGEVYRTLGKKGGDIILVGNIRDRGRGIRFEIGLFDKDQKIFLFRKSFLYSREELNLGLNKSVEEVSNYIIRYLTPYKKSRLEVKTNPSDALVFIDEGRYNRSPFSKELSIGYHDIVVMKEGFKKVSGKIYIRDKVRQTLSINLNKEQNKGGLVILSEPAGADIYLDLEYKGTSPLVLKDISTGIYKVRLEKDGYSHLNTIVDVEKGKNLRLFFPMREGRNEYQAVEELSRSYNIVKNVFLYSSFVSLGAFIYGALYEQTYADRYKASGKAGVNLQNELFLKTQQMTELKNNALYTLIGLVSLTILFQVLELYAEDVDIILKTPKAVTYNSFDYFHDDVQLSLSIKF